MALIPIAIGAVSGLMQGQQQKEQADNQAAALRRNAMYLNQSAADAKVRGMQESDLSRLQTSQLIGTQRAAMAASGGVVDMDSNALIQQDTAQLGELDALTISNNAAREAYGYQVEASETMRTAKTLKAQGARAPMTSMLGGALQGAGSSFGGGSFGGGGNSAGISLQGQSRPLYNNAAYVRNM